MKKIYNTLRKHRKPVTIFNHDLYREENIDRAGGVILVAKKVSIVSENYKQHIEDPGSHIV